MYLDDKYPQYSLLPHDVPKRALNFQVAHIVFQNNVIEKKVGPHEKLPWAQSIIRKGFTVQGHLSFEIPLILIISLQYVVQDHLEDFNWCCRGKCNPTTHSRGLVWVINILLAVKFKLIGVKIAPLGINKGMNTDTIVKAKSFLDGDEDQHEKDVFEKNLKALQKIF
ncbi:uncharacterized protein [Arachis hypogaea]|uniref:uncharacterized protein isoform X1 n=1 Tax=Arachis hypogaea TaxID=3818 RepID=UPI000DEC3B20|nr:uncharacterized protein LOC112710581 isoform X1 [Arachis hypogaea]XP_025618642.1 uncharacterized protein LOC112710581 isoform X1 [Arachis hypogaea]XP_029144763.1 uncharacterized protein LOC112710581 isoform X1 [Arachis hypogaea]